MKLLSLFLALLVVAGSQDAPAADHTFTVATLKVMPKTGHKAANYAVAERLIREAAARGASLIVTGEAYLDGYSGNTKFAPGMTREKLSTLAEPIDGPWVKKAMALARELRVHLIFCFSEARGAKIFNTAALIDPAGELIGRYCKSHTGARELYDAGDELPVFETKLGRIGVLLCFDRQPPESARVLALQGAQVIVVPAYGTTSSPIDEDLLMRARAYENGLYVVYTSPYNAFVAGPGGTMVAQVRNETDGLMFAELVLDGRLGSNSAQRRRRPELYDKLLTDGKK